ncbi:mannose-6-phosphate isomerase, class I [soil metagenome]
MRLVLLSNVVLEGLPVFVGITNTPRDYAWGARGAISELLGQKASGAPEAELWLGAHPASPSRIIDPAQAGGASDLAAWIAADPATALGATTTGQPRLPFLLKVLAADSPLSLQAHPTAQQAIAGFAREHADGIPLTAPDRNYKDAYPKPEIIYALEDGFEALCGFRPLAETHAEIARLIALDVVDPESERGPLHRWLNETTPGSDLRPVMEWLLSKGTGVRELVDRVVKISRANPDEFPTAVLLADAYPGDPGILISQMLNRVSLKRGEVLYLAAGNIHSYLKGIGVELMTSSDNVLRGGLTPKHIDVTELLDVVDFTPGPAPYLPGVRIDDAVTRFSPPDVDFELTVISGDGLIKLGGPAIVLCVDGAFDVTGAAERRPVKVGDSFYSTADEDQLHFVGSGTAFVAMTV